MDVTDTPGIATPRPWKVGPYYKHDVLSDEGLVCECGPMMSDRAAANAALIVHRVNHYEQMEAALRRSLDWLASYPGGGAQGAYDQARDALLCGEGRGENEKKDLRS